MRLVCRKSDALDDWYVIEREEAPGEARAWLEPIGGGGMAFMVSARISDADIEGYADEMLAIAEAIEKRGAARFKRCAVNAETEPVHFWSPRNSTRDGEVSLAVADALAKEIRSVCAAAQPKEMEGAD